MSDQFCWRTCLRTAAFTFIVVIAFVCTLHRSMQPQPASPPVFYAHSLDVPVVDDQAQSTAGQQMSWDETPRENWAGVIIHHSSSDKDTVEGIDAWHRKKGWNGIGYHCVIAADGRVTWTHRWKEGRDGAHCTGHNDAVGVCLIGNLNAHPMTEEQGVALQGVLRYLKELGITQVSTHRANGKTECPGKYFQMPGGL